MTTYYVDPVNGSDAYAGDSFASGHPWKTLKHSFAAGDIIQVAKSAETSLSGTVTATNGSVSVNTTADLTAVLAQYSIIRIGGDNTLYMVKAITSTVITIHRPYRGTTGSGKSATHFASLPTSASSDWQPNAMTGTAASPITVNGGINTSSLVQDGFTILYGNNATYLISTTPWVFVNMSRVASLYFTYPYNAPMTDCNFTNIFSFRNSGRFSLTSTWTRVTVNGIVAEVAKFPYGLSMFDCAFNQPETAEPVVSSSGLTITGPSGQVLFNQWRNAGYAGASNYAIQFTTHCEGFRFVDPILDELASGCPLISLSSTVPLYIDAVFQNPNIGSGTLFSISATGAFLGSIKLVNVGGDGTDQRTYLGNPIAGKYALRNYDASTYHTAAPSAKISLQQSSSPTIIRHYIPCDAGVSKTISVWMMKNASYGSDTRPIMRLRWVTGTGASMVSNVHDVQMIDNTSWQQLSYAVTPSVKGSIIMELIFESANSGAIAWYDDIGVA